MSDADSTYLLGIGDFSRFATLSVRMLRHYDERGLLTPAHVDPLSGYRFYAPAQLRTAARIRTLRDAGCGIAQIAQMLPLFEDPGAPGAPAGPRSEERASRPVGWDPGALARALDDHARSLAVAAQQIADQRSLVATIREQIKERSMSITVAERTIGAMQILSMRRTIASYSAEGDLWQEFGAFIKGPDGPPMSQFGKSWGATFFDTDYREADIDMSVWAEFRGRCTPPAGFTVGEVPERRVAWATMVGPYEQTAAVCQAIGAWISDHGHTLAGPMFNIYVVGPSQDPNPQNWVTEINFPIQ